MTSTQNNAFTYWQTASYEETIAHILTRYHQHHKEQLEELLALAQKVEDRHADHPECPKGLAAALEVVYADLVNHMMKEEQILFPMIKSGNYAMAQMPIRVMEFEHDEHQKSIAMLKSLTNEMTPPEGACQSWQTLYAGIQEFIEDLNNHIHTENEILFTRVLAE